MDADNDKWLNALAGNNEAPDEAEMKVAHSIGTRLRQSFHSDAVNEKALGLLIQRLENENLLQNKKRYKKHYWQYGIAATLFIAVLIPIVMLKAPINNNDYPIMRGIVDTQKIKVVDSVIVAKNLQSKLKAIGYQSQVFKYNDNLIIMFNVAEVTPEIKSQFNDIEINIIKVGPQYIELIKSDK